MKNKELDAIFNDEREIIPCSECYFWNLKDNLTCGHPDCEDDEPVRELSDGDGCSYGEYKGDAINADI